MLCTCLPGRCLCFCHIPTDGANATRAAVLAAEPDVRTRSYLGRYSPLLIQVWACCADSSLRSQRRQPGTSSSGRPRTCTSTGARADSARVRRQGPTLGSAPHAACRPAPVPFYAAASWHSMNGRLGWSTAMAARSADGSATFSRDSPRRIQYFTCSPDCALRHGRGGFGHLFRPCSDATFLARMEQQQRRKSQRSFARCRLCRQQASAK